MRYFNGEVQVQATDLSSGGFGLGWAHTRTFTNRMSASFDRGQGWNWNVENWPYLVPSTFPGSSLALLGNLYDIDWFQENADGSYTTLFGRLKTLEHDETADVFRLIEADGTVFVFNDLSHATRPGAFKSVTSPGGKTTEVFHQSGSDILEVRRSYTSGSDTITESFLYDFIVGGENANRLERVTLRRRVNAGAWQNVLKADYTYYGTGASFGSLNDLETAKRYEWSGSAWTQLDTTYYRYWRAGEANGLEHGLRYVVGPEAYAQLLAAGHNPLTASNTVVAQFADFYFEYNAQRFVTKEIVDGGSRTFTFGYTVNPNYVAGQPRDFNFWMRRTVETLPDGTQNIVYCNANGQTMLKILKSGTSEWYEFTRYDDVGRAILEASSSAVSGYDETRNDLLNYNPVTGTYQHLKDNDGLIRLTEFHTTTGGGAAAGYLKARSIQRGELGTPIKLREWQYTSHSAGGVTVFPVSKEIVYPDDVDQTRKIETSYAYTFHAGTTQVDQKTTVLPVIPTAQNGSGVANSFVDVFDAFGNRVWHRNERGFITRFKYDIETGALVQRIDDVDTAQVSDEPAGWTTPSGGGLQLLTDFEHDDQGRTVQTLGPVHEIDLNGTATQIRTAAWTVYKDDSSEVWSGRGFQKVSDSTFTLVNPVSITRTDKNGNATDEIQAVRSATAGKLQPSDSFPQSSWVRWSSRQYTDCCKLISTRVYHNIPGTGEGASGTNYDQTDFGYDLRDRRNRVVSAGGTITFTVFDARSLPAQVWVGTNDNGATEEDPSGGGATGNNMVVVTSNAYDGGVAGGDGNLTSVTQHVDAGTTRVTTFGYDWRNRQTDVDGEIDFFQKLYYDSLDRVVKRERYDTTAAGNLIARDETRYDDLGRVYRTIRYAVDPSTGAVGNSLTDNQWYDARGNVLKSLPAGAKLFAKTVSDGLDRPTKRYVGFDLSETSYTDAGNVTGDTILEQVETTYDAAGNAIQGAQRQRYHNATGTGELGSPTSAEPKARVTYVAAWADAIGRVQASADYGTNGGTPLSRPATIPARADNVLVTATVHESTGAVQTVTDRAGMVTLAEYDDAGRRTKVIENYQPSTSSASSSSGGCAPSSDTNRETRFSYTADGNLATLTAVNASTGNQVTSYTFGTTLTDSAIAMSLLLRKVAYPDSSGPSDVVSYTWNRQAEQVTVTDQRGCVHTLDRDGLARLVHDRVTTLGTGLDGTVRRLSFGYEVRGLPETLASHDNASVGVGAVVNQVKLLYNDFGQMVADQQSHDGAVTMSTPKVQYGYASGTANTIRRTSLVYPNGRTLTISYGAGGGTNDAASRVEALIDSNPGATHLAEYAYLGLSSPVVVDYTEPQLKFTLVGTQGSNDPDTGDIYRGLDRFGRVKDALWYDYGSLVDAARIQYGYDRASNRTWRQDPVAAANNARFDELYAYDGLQRLQAMRRGTLDAQHSTINPLTFAQCWTLDETGNWKGFRTDDNGDGTWDLIQSRTTNEVNEITGISENAGPSWADPAYDTAGNMTTLPRPVEPVTTYDATYDAWNRLMVLREDDGAGGLQAVAENRYDARWYRITAERYVSGSLSETRHHYYSIGWQALEERLGTSPATASADRQFVWGIRYIDALVLRDRDTTADGTLDERLFVLQDGNWNVLAIADASGELQERYSYDPYGARQVLTPGAGARPESLYDWDHAYSGYRLDAADGLYNVRTRQLHANVGCFLSRDIPGAVKERVSLYEYAWSRPLVAVDPLGQIGIFFDGAGQSKGSGTQLQRLFRAYNGHAIIYYTHVWPNNIWANIRAAHLAVCVDVCKRVVVDCEKLTHECKGGQEPVDIFGWSRGGVAALTLATLLKTEGCVCHGNCITRRRGRFRTRSTIRPVMIRFLGLIDPVNTGGAQMWGTTSDTIEWTVRDVWIADATKSTGVGEIVFDSDIPEWHNPFLTNRVVEQYNVTHEQSGFNKTIGADLEQAAKAAGAPFP